jgi:geranylgeranyl diphosphate synthase type II
MDIQAYFRDRIPLVDRVLDAAVAPADAEPVELHAAMRHILFPGGKRLRPVLAMATAEALGAPPERVLPLAAAVELVHTYSLIHDDLPCMDDDDERRGVPSVHIAFGEAVALLAGDALLAAAFEVLAVAASEATAEQRLAASRDLAHTAGSLQLVGGQVDDLTFEPEDVDPERIESVHARKSAALIAMSIVGGAQLAGSDAATLAKLRRCGQAAGIAFQIADDVLDADENDLCSAVRAWGKEAAQQRAENLLASALVELEEFGDPAESLRELLRFAVRRTL